MTLRSCSGAAGAPGLGELQDVVVDDDVGAAARDAVAEVGRAQVGRDQVDALGERRRLERPRVDADDLLDARVGARRAASARAPAARPRP